MTWCSLCWRFVQWCPHLNRRAPAVITYYSGSTTLVCDVWQERHSHSARLQSPPPTALMPLQRALIQETSSGKVHRCLPASFSSAWSTKRHSHSEYCRPCPTFVC